MTSRVSTAGAGRGRLTLLPGLRRLWRDETAVQLGADPSRAIIIELPDPGAARVLDLLDGSRTERAVLRDATAIGVPRSVTLAMLAALRSANLVIGTDALVPPTMPESVRRRLVTEAAAIAMAARSIDIPGLDSPALDTPALDAPDLDPAGLDTRCAHNPRPGTPGLDTPGPDTPGLETVAHREPSAIPDSSAHAAQVVHRVLDGSRALNDAGPSTSAVRACDGAWIETPEIMARSVGSPSESTVGAPAAGGGVPRQRGSRPAPAPAAVAPAEAMRRRAAASVQVAGGSRLVVPIAAGLARAGVGHVDPAISGRVGVHDDTIGGFTPADTDRPRGTAASEAVLRAAPFTDTRALRAGGASFVVQIGQGVPAELAAFAYARKALPHLLIEERDDTVLVGPLVPPNGSPCLRCLDLHRRDLDPDWPTLVAQLATSLDTAPTISIATTLIAVGVAVAQVLSYLDSDGAPTIGASIEIGPPSTVRRRSWAAHPKCECSYRTRHRQRLPANARSR